MSFIHPSHTPDWHKKEQRSPRRGTGPGPQRGRVKLFSAEHFQRSRSLFLRQWGDCEIESSDTKEIGWEASVKCAVAAGKVAAHIRQIRPW